MSDLAPNLPPAMALRPADQVMRLKRMGSMHQSRLSFMRILLRRLKSENWTFERRKFEIDANGVGHAVITAQGPKRAYSLVAFAHDLPDELRSDRVIAEAWDCTFTLFDGVPTEADIERLSQNVPYQEAGRISDTELTLSRANRSARAFEHVVGCLAAGNQPDPDILCQVGYLMRTTAVYGSGKFGAADHAQIVERPEFTAPFQAEMLTVFLIRMFVRDLVNAVAKGRAPDKAVTLSPKIARQLGIGNSTGLGMAPFLINHPTLLNNWMAAKETALARVRAVKNVTAEDWTTFKALVSQVTANLGSWVTEHPYQVEKLSGLRQDLALLVEHLAGTDASADHTLDALVDWSEDQLSLEGQELLVSILLEPFSDLVDGLATCMSAVEEAVWPLDGQQDVAALNAEIEAECGWALAPEWGKDDAHARVWYVSEEKLEPRMGERAAEPIEPYEHPLDSACAIMRLHKALQNENGTVAAFLLAHPEHRMAVRRVQSLRKFPYAEIRDNTICATLMPVDMLRCKLSFFGATEFDPRSDRWVRINMFKNAPYPDELAGSDADLWAYGFA